MSDPVQVNPLISKWGLAIFGTCIDRPAANGGRPLAPVASIAADPTIYCNGKPIALGDAISGCAATDTAFVAYPPLCGGVLAVVAEDGGAGFSGDVTVDWTGDGTGLVLGSPTPANGGIRTGVVGCRVIDGGIWDQAPAISITGPPTYAQADGGNPASYHLGMALPLSPTVKLTGVALAAGKSMVPGQSVASPSGGFSLIMQGDGNLVIYGPAGKVVWATMTDAHPGANLVMQADGNLVVYGPTGAPLWATMTNGNPGANLHWRDDGNVSVCMADDAVIWSREGGMLTINSVGPDAGGIMGCGWGYVKGSYPTVTLGGGSGIGLAVNLDPSGGISGLVQSGTPQGYPELVAVNFHDPSGKGSGALTIWGTTYNGWPKLIQPGSGYGQDAIATIVPATSFKATLKSGSAVMTAVSNPGAVPIGMGVAGPGIPAGAVVMAGDATGITLSANATADGAQDLYAFTMAVIVADVDDYIAGVPVTDPGIDFTSPPTFTAKLASGTPSRPAELLAMMTGPAPGDVLTYDAPAKWLVALDKEQARGGQPLADVPAVKGLPMTNSAGAREPAVGGFAAFSQKPTIIAGVNVGAQMCSPFYAAFTAKNKLRQAAWTCNGGTLTADDYGRPVSWTGGTTLQKWVYGPAYPNYLDGMEQAGYLGEWSLYYKDSAAGTPQALTMDLTCGGNATLTPVSDQTNGTATTKVVRVELRPDTTSWEPQIYLTVSAPTGADGLCHWTVSDDCVTPPDAITGLATPPDPGNPLAADDSFIRQMTGPNGTALGFARWMDNTQGWGGVSGYIWPWELLVPDYDPWSSGIIKTNVWATVGRYYNTDPAKGSTASGGDGTYNWPATTRVYGGQAWFNQADTPFTITGTLTAGSADVLNLSNNALMVGSTVTGDGVPTTDAYGNPTRIAAIPQPADRFRLSAPATKAGTVTLTITNPNYITIPPGDNGNWISWELNSYLNAIIELKFDQPHGLTSGRLMEIWTNGNSGVNFSNTNGPFAPTTPNGGPIWVTGPDTIVMCVALYGLATATSGPMAQGVAGTKEIDLKAAGAASGWLVYGEVPVSEQCIPYHHAMMAAKEVGCGLWLNVPARATDDLARTLGVLAAQYTGDTIPILLEWSNEIWNGGSAYQEFSLCPSLSKLWSNAKIYPPGTKIATYYTATGAWPADWICGSAVPLAAHLYDAFTAGFVAGGGDPTRILHGMGSNFYSPAMTAAICAAAALEGVRIDHIAVAPYIEASNDPSLVRACAPAGSMDGAGNMPIAWINEIQRYAMAYGGNGGNAGWLNQATWGEHEQACRSSGLSPVPTMVCYEGGPDRPVPSATPSQYALIHDCLAHPSWFDVIYDWYGACGLGDQTMDGPGAAIACFFQAYSIRTYPAMWTLVDGPNQPAGDGASFVEDATGQSPRPPNRYATPQGGPGGDGRDHNGGFPGNASPGMLALRAVFSGTPPMPKPSPKPKPTPTPTPPAPTPTPPAPTPTPTPPAPTPTPIPTPPTTVGAGVYVSSDADIYRLVNGQWTKIN